MPTIQILSGACEGSEVTFGGDEALIGKDDTCEVKITDAGVSRKHAKLTRKGDNWIVEDLGSSNNTYVNFKKLVSGETAEVGDRAILFVGRTVAKFFLGTPPGGTNGSAGGGAVDGVQLRDLLRGVVPIAGLRCGSCNADLEPALRAKAREQEQVELIRRLKLHELDDGALDRILALARTP